MSDLPVRALSLIQPWAWCVVHGPKDIENRTWWSDIRGPFWIAASAQVTRRYYDQARELVKSIAGIDVPPLAELDYGCIIGRATITDCILPGGYAKRGRTSAQNAVTLYKINGGNWGSKCREPLLLHDLRTNPWHFVEQYGYVLADRTALVKPVPCRGHQRWWNVPQDVLEKLRGSAAA